MSKIFFFDTETTGLYSDRHSIYQLAGIIEIDGVVKHEFNIAMQPAEVNQLPDDYVTPVGGITKAQLLTYDTPKQGYKKLINILCLYVDKFNRQDKFFVAGYNCQSFDMAFLRQLFERNGDNFFGSWFWSASLDVMIMAAYYTKEQRKTMSNFKLETVAKFFGLTVGEEGYHDALADVRITREIYQILELL